VTIRGVLETCVYAADLEAAERFYADVLGLEPFARVAGRHVFFRCGAGVFLVFNPEATSVPPSAGRPVPLHGARGAGHAAFAVRAAELPPWRERLTEHGVAIEAEVEWPGGGRSLYVRDPAGNSIELATAAVWGLEEA
jgi:catechol 2,3-dioxygenase-like lactoylglutathione lyase family enzyme